MIFLLLLCIILFVVIPAFFFLVLFCLRIRSKKWLFGIPIAVFCLPFILSFGIYLIRSPIQQGKYLPEFGPLLNAVFPANDLYNPLVEETLSESKTDYSFNIMHKYVGDYAIFIIVPSSEKFDNIKFNGLEFSTRFYNSGKIILDKRIKDDPDNRGIDTLYICWYDVPKDIPVSAPLNVEIAIYGDISKFLKNYQTAKLVIKKMSDE